MRQEKRTYLGLNGGLFASWDSFLVLFNNQNLRLRLRFRGRALQGRNIQCMAELEKKYVTNYDHQWKMSNFEEK
jgi:hypothetical protein